MTPVHIDGIIEWNGKKNQNVMADILFNKSGIPLIAYGKSYQATTTGTPAEKAKEYFTA